LKLKNHKNVSETHHWYLALTKQREVTLINSLICLVNQAWSGNGVVIDVKLVAKIT